MGIFSVLNTSSSGLSAQRLRLDVIADNIANATTTRTTEGGPFRKSRVILKTRGDQPQFKTDLLPEAMKPSVGSGVRVFQVEKDMENPTRFVYDPAHPDAIKYGEKAGYVEMPNVNVVTEMVDMIEASRAYEANSTVIQSAKAMFNRALDIIR
ncbi:MAG: flagellar basal body rod protein FlgC [Spirochaetes bacterium]|nr:flagellar basal body rod protein FlgC [Spirochaetota bacterium]